MPDEKKPTQTWSLRSKSEIVPGAKGSYLRCDLDDCGGEVEICGDQGICNKCEKIHEIAVFFRLDLDEAVIPHEPDCICCHGPEDPLYGVFPHNMAD